MKSPQNRGLRSWSVFSPASQVDETALAENEQEENESSKNKYILLGMFGFGVVLVAIVAFLERTPPSEENLELGTKVLPYESSKGRVLPFHSIGPSGYPKATFGVGCFWSGEQEFQEIPGLVSTSVGYIGGDGTTTPTYETVKANTEDYVEVLTIEYDSAVTSYEDLLRKFWRMHDPTPTRYTGTQYRSAVFYHSAEQKRIALEAKEALSASGLYGDFDIVTEIDPGTVFYLAEEKHQNYYRKNEQKVFMGGH
jgi:peptide-methionine (S)-S-oxide reductase